MTHRPTLASIVAQAAPVAVLAAAISLSACGSTIPLLPEIGLPAIPTPHVVRIEETVDKPSNLIERALSGCDKRIATGEADCLRTALVQQKVTVPDLIAMLRPCRQGEVCHYQYTTDDLVGLYGPTSSHFVVHWRVDVDLTHPAGTIDTVPIEVVQV